MYVRQTRMLRRVGLRKKMAPTGDSLSLTVRRVLATLIVAMQQMHAGTNVGAGNQAAGGIKK